ncbi:phosphohistidine phosphatase SixA [Coxiella endosymbiont of Amblyomma americanum]|uniref:phosphohistidine phosphatase SixA n=1 Tax=Coxiella endosymbiont of Amblyomma americanum TaxID=325775 RepID=UPI00057D2E94|nr:phosphohistidine phosphatase SixA [Coxiella endosymbiont of Amblyomma americanum]AJC50383.1 phosphohistidine phosphatase [Coxiella endosymbiont of Amblyomma americanum]AUJ58725.1 phosphohistidine phosphatase SixA [Coxiella-like endosymbiont of Amblyomma americanum]
MKLFCVRHGHAEQLPNYMGERPLTKEGIFEIGKVATYLRRQEIQVAYLMYSEKLRARQSAKILSTGIITVSTEESALLGPQCSTKPFIDLVQGWHDDTMLVGHMPFLSHLVSALILGNDSCDILRILPGTVICLERIENHQWILNWIMHPDLIPN